MSAEERKNNNLAVLVQEIGAAALTAKAAVIASGGPTNDTMVHVQRVQALVSAFLLTPEVSLYDLVSHLTKLIRGIDDLAAEPIVMAIMVESRKIGVMEAMQLRNNQGKVN